MLTLDETGVAPATNRGLDEVMDEIRTAKRLDYACPRNQLRFTFEQDSTELQGNGYSIHLGDRFRFPTNRHFNKQLAARCAPGMTAYGRHLHSTGQQDLLVHNVNRQLERDEGAAMVRTIETSDSIATARAIMSDKYKIVDDKEVFDVALPIIGEQGDHFRTLGGKRTDTKTYAKFISREPIAQIGKRSMFAGFQMSNSEVGQGSASFRAFFFDSFCENGCTFGNIGVFQAKFVHRGSALETKFGPVFGDKFKLAEMAAIRSAIADATRQALDPKCHAQIAEIIERGHERQVTGDIPTVLDEIGRRVGLTEGEREQSLLHMDGDEAHAYGVQAAITRLAQDADSYERRVELEEAGGKVLEFSDRAWNAVASLAAA